MLLEVLSLCYGLLSQHKFISGCLVEPKLLSEAKEILVLKMFEAAVAFGDYTLPSAAPDIAQAETVVEGSQAPVVHLICWSSSFPRVIIRMQLQPHLQYHKLFHLRLKGRTSEGRCFKSWLFGTQK